MLAKLAKALGEPVTGWVSTSLHGHNLWNHGTAIIAGDPPGKRFSSHPAARFLRVRFAREPKRRPAGAVARAPARAEPAGGRCALRTRGPAPAACAVGLDRDVWSPFVHHDPDAHQAICLHSQPALEIWLICWLAGQSMGIHRHVGALVACTSPMAASSKTCCRQVRPGDGPAAPTGAARTRHSASRRAGRTSCDTTGTARRSPFTPMLRRPQEPRHGGPAGRFSPLSQRLGQCGRGAAALARPRGARRDQSRLRRDHACARRCRRGGPGGDPWYGSLHRGSRRKSAVSTTRFEESRLLRGRFVGSGNADDVVFVRHTTEAANLLAVALPPGPVCSARRSSTTQTFSPGASTASRICRSRRPLRLFSRKLRTRSTAADQLRRSVLARRDHRCLERDRRGAAGRRDRATGPCALRARLRRRRPAGSTSPDRHPLARSRLPCFLGARSTHRSAPVCSSRRRRPGGRIAVHARRSGAQSGSSASRVSTWADGRRRAPRPGRRTCWEPSRSARPATR